MKKFLFLLTLALMITSCGFNGKNGSLNFTISSEQMQKFAENVISERQGEYGNCDMRFLVQILGSDGFYTRQIKGSSFSYISDNGTVSFANQSNEVTFSFDTLPSDQTYTVMLDMFIKDENEDTSENLGFLRLFSTESKGVQISEDSDNSVIFRVPNNSSNLAALNDSDCYIQYSYNDGRNTQILTLTSENYLKKQNGELYIDNNKIDSLKVVSESNKHVTKADKQYVRLYCSGRLEAVAGTFNGTYVSILDTLKNLSFDEYSEIQCIIYAVYGNYEFIYNDISIKTQKTDTNPDDDLFPITILPNSLTFTHDSSISQSAYSTEISFVDLDFNSGDTVAFILETKNEESSPLYVQENSTRQLNYYLKTQNDEQKSFDVIKYTNPCNGENLLRLVIPCNNIPDDVKSLILYYEQENTQSQDSNITIKYKNFGNTVYVFKNWENKKDGINYGNSRFEMDLRLSENNPALSFVANTSIYITLNGSIHYFSQNQNNHLDGFIRLTSELYQNTEYDDNGNTLYYYPLSKDMLDDNTPNENNNKEKIVELNNTIDDNTPFTFAQINEPMSSNIGLDIRFQCYVEGKPEDTSENYLKFDEDGLLYIKNFAYYVSAQN